MSRFKNESKTHKNLIFNWLKEQGFSEVSGARGEEGLTKTYKVDKIYYVWITINIDKKKIYIYKEYDCGGCVGEDEIKIKEEWLESLGSFIDNVDEVLEMWID